MSKTTAAHDVSTSGARTETPQRVWHLGDAGEFDGMIELSRTLEGNLRWVCHRSLAARNNLVADAMARGNSLADTTFDELSGRLVDHIEGVR